MNAYEERKQTRIEYYKSRAIALKHESIRLEKRASDMAAIIPMGQPILIGHHSERGDRSYRSKIHNTFCKASDTAIMAERCANKADRMESNRTISSDDPAAIDKLDVKIAQLEAKQKFMVEVNKIIRGKQSTQEKIDILKTMGITDVTATKFVAESIGFESYALTNNNANIRRLRERLKMQEKAADNIYKETQYGNIKLIENPDVNRIQIMFPRKPGRAEIDALKRNGFKWSPYNKVWQRHLNNQGRWAAQNVLKIIGAIKE